MFRFAFIHFSEFFFEFIFELWSEGKKRHMSAVSTVQYSVKAWKKKCAAVFTRFTRFSFAFIISVVHSQQHTSVVLRRKKIIFCYCRCWKNNIYEMREFPNMTNHFSTHKSRCKPQRPHYCNQLMNFFDLPKSRLINILNIHANIMLFLRLIFLVVFYFSAWTTV